MRDKMFPNQSNYVPPINNPLYNNNDNNNTTSQPAYCSKQSQPQIIADPIAFYNNNTNTTTGYNSFNNQGNTNQIEPFSNINGNSLSVQKVHNSTTNPLYSTATSFENIWGSSASDKIELIEINSKDLSPATSYCSNLDWFMPDFLYKNNFYNNSSCSKFDGGSTQWFNNNNTNNSNMGSSMNFYNNQQKNVEYPACAQQDSYFPSTNQGDKKYCAIQNNMAGDYSNHGNVASTTTTFEHHHGNNNYQHFSNTLVQGPYSNNQFNILINSGNYQQGALDCCSNDDESDIIVEESDEEDYEVVNSSLNMLSHKSKCIICNVQYQALGAQFYLIGPVTPLTMSTQRPIYSKIEDLTGTNILNLGNDNFDSGKYVCSECLGLINTIDHLQLKLDNFKSELVNKFNRNVGLEPPRIRSTVKNHVSLKKYKIRCKTCKKVLCLEDMCRRHLKSHVRTCLLCEICGRTSKSRLHFKLHFYRRHYSQDKIRTSKGVVNNNKENELRCTNCAKVFNSKFNLRTHTNFCLGLLPFNCKFCDKKFPAITKLKNHVKLKHDKKFIAICSICNIGFVKLSDYKAHKTSHSTDKKFSCAKCDKSYKTLSNLNFHMKLHSKELPFGCDICKRGFMRKEYLEAHVNNHNGVKNFKCGICGKTFVSQKNLDAHLKYHDGTLKTRNCNVCGKEVVNSGFDEHLRIHSNLREFECDLCESRFNTKGTLAKHKKRKHKC